MPDGSTAATFILNHFVADLFNSRSLSHKSEIDEFNAALVDQARKRNESRQSLPFISSMMCSVCSKDMSKNNSKIVPCVSADCFAKMHTKCFRKHLCPYVGTKQKPTETTQMFTDSQVPISTSCQQLQFMPSSSSSSTMISNHTATTSTLSFSSIIAVPASTM